MKKININGHEINTNYGRSSYPILPDYMNVEHVPDGMTDRSFLEKKAEEGYKKVTFYEMTTCVRGYHNLYANCK